jgi:hypothetical protein
VSVRFAAIVPAAARFAQLHEAQHSHASRKPHEHHTIGNAYEQLTTPAVLAVSQPVPHPLLGFLNHFSVHGDETVASPCPHKNFYSCFRR